MEIFRNNLKWNKDKYIECQEILNYHDFFKFSFRKKLLKLQKIINAQEVISYLFYLINEMIKNEKEITSNSIYKIDYILNKTKLDNYLNIEERNNYFNFKNEYLSKNRKIKLINFDPLQKNEKIYLEFKTKKCLIYLNNTLQNEYENLIIYISNLSLSLHENILYKNFLWTELKKYEITTNSIIFYFNKIKIELYLTNFKADLILFNRLIKERKIINEW